MPTSASLITSHRPIMNLSNLNLGGKISPTIGNLKNLQSMDLQRNKLTGQIPDETGYCVSLILVDLSDNLMYGDIPFSISKLKQLELLYKGTYCSQEVAIEVLKPERIDSNLQKEFAQEVFIMRKVRHKNVVQFVGACTKPPSLCIVTEYMSGGSVYDYLHKQKGTFKLPSLLRVAIDVSKGMNYLHQNNIIHRDLKAANLLIDENEVVKVADFGVARVKAQTGVMTAETRTYRWMAPEIKSLLGTKVEWPYYILEVFNSGDLVCHQELCQVRRAALSAEPPLVENEKNLLEKINILCLMEIIFSRPSEDRTIPLAELTKLTIEDVEYLLMKSLSVSPYIVEI